MTLKTLLVGSHFVPPAKVLLEHLPAGASLSLLPDPENPYDPLAVKVLVRPGAVPQSQHEELRIKLPGMGQDWDELLAQGEALMLGHLASSEGKPLLKARDQGLPWLVGNKEFLEVMGQSDSWWAELDFAPTGAPLVALFSKNEV